MPAESKSSRVESRRDRIRSDQDEMATKSPQDMVRESALLQAGGARWAESNANEHATNVAGGKQARRARRAGDVQQIAGGERGGYRRLEFRVAAIGVVASLCFWRCCRKGTLAARPLRALGGDLGETRALMEALYLPMC